MSCFCGECPYCRRTDSNLNIELAAAKDEIRIGASLCAKLTDTKNDLESELAAAMKKIDKINSLHGYILLERHNQIDTLESENKRLREALKSYASCCDGCTCGDGWDHEPAQSALDGKGGEA